MDARVQPFHSRGHTHILKFALLEALSERCELRITEHDMYQAGLLFDDLQPLIKEAMRGVARTKHSTHMDLILSVLKRRGGSMTQGELQKALHGMRRGIPPRELAEILQSLAGVGVLTYEQVQRTEGHKPAWLLTLQGTEER